MRTTITEGMVEAGEVAYVKAKAQSPTALVAAVYAAMDERREVEEERRKNTNHEKPVYVHQEWPKWVDDPAGDGKGKVFAKASDIPPEWRKARKAA